MNKEKNLPELEIVNCNLCRHNDTRLVCKNHDRIHNADGYYNIVQCKHCGLIYVNPRPTSESIARYYPNSYGPYRQINNNSNDNAVSGHNFIKLALKRIYHLISLKWLLDRIEVKNTILPSISKVNQETRLLDIGCVTGKFLRSYREKYGCKVYGVEINKDAADYARGHNIQVYNGDFLTNNFPNSFFNCITMWWFLEHTHNPKDILRKIWRILKKNGVVVIGVPNGTSLGRCLFGNKWYGYDTPRHLYIFSPRIIRQLLLKTGFKVIAIKYDYSTWDLMGSLQYLLFDEKYLPGKKVGNIQGNRIARLFMMPLGLLQGILRISGTIVVYAKKINRYGGI